MVDVTVVEAVRQLVKSAIAPRASMIEREDQFPHDVLQAYRAAGLLTLAFDEEARGVGATLPTMCAVIREIARTSPACATILLGHTTACLAMRMAGAAGALEAVAKQFPNRPAFLGICITEPESGSDVASIRTAADPDGAGWILRGQKRFVTNGPEADAFVVLARTAPRDQELHHLSLFLVDRRAEGVSVGRPERKLGLRGSSTADVTFTDVRVPPHHLIGEAGSGFGYVMKTLDRTRTIVAALAVGIAEGALDQAVRYSQVRKQFGRPIGEFQGIRFALADMAARVAAAAALTREAAEAVEGQVPTASLFASMAKLCATETASRVAADAVQVLGGYGVMADYGVERFMRDAKVTEIYEGTNQIQRVIIARELMALVAEGTAVAF
ncbi:MAG: acyl-CoA dehydrogenase family protein [Actinomycetia bacterium]|nr:acyl-CoA dehydrogenase family protein [Actinomycetes bacterium]